MRLASVPPRDIGSGRGVGRIRTRSERPSRTRIADVGRAACVSKTAVSFAFNNPDKLPPATASRILQVATAMGYRPHPVARAP